MISYIPIRYWLYSIVLSVIYYLWLLSKLVAVQYIFPMALFHDYLSLWASSHCVPLSLSLSLLCSLVRSI